MNLSSWLWRSKKSCSEMTSPVGDGGAKKYLAMKRKAFDKFRQIYYHITVNQNTFGEAVSRLRRKGEPIGNNVRSSFLFNTNKTRFRDVFQDAILRSFAPRSGVCYIYVVNKQCFCALLVFILQRCNGLAPRSDMFYPCYTNGKCCQFVATKRSSLAEKYTFWVQKYKFWVLTCTFENGII